MPSGKLLICVTFFFIIAHFATGQEVTPLINYVDPMIGTGGHGHTFPGASMPFGMVQLSPDTRLEGWDGCSGFYGSDTVVYGFSHTHLSGTGCSDYGDILFMPVTGEVSLANYGYRSSIHTDIKREHAFPGFYHVWLDRYRISVDLTASLRAGFQRYTFPSTEKPSVIIDLRHRDKVLESSLRVVSSMEIEGMRVSEAWADKQTLYFVARFSRPFNTCYVNTLKGFAKDGIEILGDSLIARLNFSAGGDTQLLIKVGISAVSIDGARRNLDTEIPDWDFDAVRKKAENEWIKELGKVEVAGGTIQQKKVFYTALYHSFLCPNLYSDVDGRYRGRDLKIHTASGFNYYTVFSLWDTYRAAHPLYALVQPQRDNDFIRTFLKQYEEGGLLPVWELSANETNCMIGYHAVPVITDAWVKGIRNFDATVALAAMKHSAEQDTRGLNFYKSKGYIPGDKEGESVSKTLEYSYDDWCISQFAKSLGKTEDYNTYIRRAQYYRNIFDPSTGFMRAKMNETWASPFDPSEVNFNFTEANSWQYSFGVPQDISGLIKLQGGSVKFSEKLDVMFSADTKTTGREQSDISGMIGQYAHGNEPSHHMAYLYDYAGQPWKTQELVHKICSELYSDERDGLCGNEDCGQMSSWFVFSAMGFYPVTPGSVNYAIGTPFFPEVRIKTASGKIFTITARNLNAKNIYIQSATLNGKIYGKCYITHADLLSGGVLNFVMGPAPNKSWGSKPGQFPVSSIIDQQITPVPAFTYGKKNFTDSTVIRIAAQPGCRVYFTTDGSEPTIHSSVWSAPLTITSTTVINAFSSQEGRPESFRISAIFRKIPKDRKIELLNPYSAQYTGGGELALIDGEKGSTNFRTGAWQGYEGLDMAVIVDLGGIQPVHSLSAEFLQDQRSWIFMPLDVTFLVSDDGKQFAAAGQIVNDLPSNREEPTIKEFTLAVPFLKTRYIKVVAKNRGICPDWHPGAGSKAWIFADEITIE